MGSARIDHCHENFSDGLVDLRPPHSSSMITTRKDFP